VTASRPSQAARSLQEELQAALSCVTLARLSVSPGGFDRTPPGALPHTMRFSEQPVSLPGPARIAVAIDHHYRITQPAPGGPWRAATAAYLYALDDEHGREILAYHWHPDIAGAERIAYPHLHISHGAVDVGLLNAAQRSRQANALCPEFHRLHLPTRRIALEDVIGLLIEQFQVTPARADWSRVLQRSRERFEVTRTWV
jgi:hypothetical protein